MPGQKREPGQFAAVRTEGGLLPADLLQRIASRETHLPGTSEEDYHLGAGERLNETISRSWNRLLGVWSSYRKAWAELPDSDLGTRLTRERWLLPFFQELGYGRLMMASSPEIDGKAYAISHFWQNTPVHLLSARVELDRRSPGVAGAATASPHGLVQEFLNRSEESLWAFVSNGETLRILRDNLSLTRQAYVEFDLKAIFDGEFYADFALLWVLCHESRVASEDPEECWLEQWSREARQQGIRALEALRPGVKRAIEVLGQGFLAHPNNQGLRNALREGDLSPQAYYRLLLRAVYRLIFLFTAEDRDLLLLPEEDALPGARERYARYYSTRRLRTLAERKRGTRHPDLWKGFGVVVEALRTEGGCPPLALPALGGFLWEEGAGEDWSLENRSFLEAVWNLALVDDDGALRRVDYRNLGPEELGSVYESLLELKPEVEERAGRFSLIEVQGNERKATGSYYTHEKLIQAILDFSLDPAIHEALDADDREQALLDLKVLDPAVGSGHFLISAAHRIAVRLAGVRTGEDEPSPLELRDALRDVISHCLHGVDVNPMAAELCKVSLWLEALQPGKPLTFLDHHIQVGNSFLGTRPDLIEKGIPDDAFTAVEGDDNQWVSSLRRENQQAHRGQQSLLPRLAAESRTEYSSMAERVRYIEDAPEDTLGDLKQKEQSFRALRDSEVYSHQHLIADAWCAAFVWPKREDSPAAITEETFRQILRDPGGVSAETIDEIRRLSAYYRFFHFHLAFPQVFGDAETLNDSGNEKVQGFDVVLGNPPWDTMSPDLKEFFAPYDPEVRRTDKGGQQAIVDRLLENPRISDEWYQYRRDLFASVHFIKRSGRFRLFAPGNLGKGDFNTYRFLVETALQVCRTGGFVAQLAPDGFATGANAMAIRKELFERFCMDALLGFVNQNQVWFRGVTGGTKFVLYTAKKGGSTEWFRSAFDIASPEQLEDVLDGATLRYPVELVHRFSPEALSVLGFHAQAEIDAASTMFERWPRFGDESAGPPMREYQREVDMGNDRDLFTEDPSGLPVYEGRMVDQYDHRAKGYRSGRGRSAVWEPLSFGDPTKSIQPQWRIEACDVPDKCRERIQRFRIGFCDGTGPRNQRSLLATILPPQTVAGHTVPTIVFPHDWEWAYLPWLAVANSFCMDWLLRKQVANHVTWALLDSLPFPRIPQHHPFVEEFSPLILRLVVTGPEMIPYWNRMAEFDLVEPLPSDADPPGWTDDENRGYAVARLEAAVAHDLYGLSRKALERILNTFPVVEKSDRNRFGEFRTKQRVLAEYDRLVGVSVPTEGKAEPEEKVVPAGAEFLIVEHPSEEEKFNTVVPLRSLRPAAGTFGEHQHPEMDGWVTVPGEAGLSKHYFVAPIEGESMEPRIPNGAYCLFRRPVLQPDSGDILLVQLHDDDAPEQGGQYAIKRFQRREPAGHDAERDIVGILESLNPDVPDRHVEADEGSRMQPVAQFVRVISTHPPRRSGR